MFPAAQSLIEPPVAAHLLTEDDLPYDDDMPMETLRHRLQMELLIHSLEPWAAARGDVYVSGNQFVYFSPNQVLTHNFRGPDVFVVCGVSPHERKSWVVWAEGKAPDVVIELLSASTTADDKQLKKGIYQTKLQAPNYFWMDPFDPEDRSGFVLQNRRYISIQRDKDGCLPVPSLGLRLCLWPGKYLGVAATWLRWADDHGLLLLAEEAERQQANTETQKAQIQQQRAETAEQELIRLRAELARLRSGS